MDDLYQLVESILATDSRIDRVTRSNAAEDGEDRLVVTVGGEDHFLVIT